MKRIILVFPLIVSCSIYEGGADTDSFDESSSGDDYDSPFEIPSAQSVLDDPPLDPSVELGPVDSTAPALEVHPGDTITVSIPFSAPNMNVVGGGIRFGTSGPIAVVPVQGAQGTSSGTMQFDVEIPPDICNNLSQICHDIKCYEFAVTSAGAISAANIGDIALACGNCDEPSCQDLLTSCQLDCDSQFVAGGDVPETHDVELGQSSGVVDFSYDTYSQEDRILVSYQGTVLYDTGCVGASGTVPLTYNGTSTSITVEVQPNCASPGSTGTSWDFSVSCPS